MTGELAISSVEAPAVRSESEKLIEYRKTRNRLFLPPGGRPTDFRDIPEFISAALNELNETISTHPKGAGELQNRGNATLGAIKTQFERAIDVWNLKRKENTSSLAWCLQYGAEQSLKSDMVADQKETREKINKNLEKLSTDLRSSGRRIETPQL